MGPLEFEEHASSTRNTVSVGISYGRFPDSSKDRERKYVWKWDMFAPYQNCGNQNAPNLLGMNMNMNEHLIFCLVRWLEKTKQVNCDLQNLIHSHPGPTKKTNQQNPSLSSHDSGNRREPGLSLDLWPDIPYLGGLAKRWRIGQRDEMRQGSLNYLFGGIKQCNCMVNSRDFPLMVHCLGW